MIVEETFYGCACDNCKTVFQNYLDIGFWADDDSAEEYAEEEDWIKDGDKIYCPTCAKFDHEDEDKLIIDLTRFKVK